MLSLKKCSFCRRDVSTIKGLVLVRNDGSVERFCSSKCRRNALKLGRDPRKLKWTAAYQKVTPKK